LDKSIGVLSAIQALGVAKTLQFATFARHARQSKLSLLVWLNANVAICVSLKRLTRIVLFRLFVVGYDDGRILTVLCLAEESLNLWTVTMVIIWAVNLFEKKKTFSLFLEFLFLLLQNHLNHVYEKTTLYIAFMSFKHECVCADAE
jgi:hypothetical protein